MNSFIDIKTRPDGSIDTAYYMARGRLKRSEAFHTSIKGVGRVLRGTPDDKRNHVRVVPAE